MLCGVELKSEQVSLESFVEFTTMCEFTILVNMVEMTSKQI